MPEPAPTFTYQLTLETTLLDGDKYGAVLEHLMDAVVTASQMIEAEGIPARLVLRDTSMIEPMVLDLDGLPN